jgi:hypothetical protein
VVGVAAVLLYKGFWVSRLEPIESPTRNRPWMPYHVGGGKRDPLSERSKSIAEQVHHPIFVRLW